MVKVSAHTVQGWESARDLLDFYRAAAYDCPDDLVDVRNELPEIGTLPSVRHLYRIATIQADGDLFPLHVYFVDVGQGPHCIQQVAQQLRDVPCQLFLISGTHAADGRIQELVFGNVRKIPRGLKAPLVQVRKLTVQRAKPTGHDLRTLDASFLGDSATRVFQAQVAAFDIERLTNAFYREYRDRFVKATNTIREANPTHPAFLDEEHGDDVLDGFTQRQFSRLMFLYFIQKKGWLANRQNFLEHWFKQFSKPTSYFQEFLNVLFFETLAVDRPDEESAFGKVPYLNGGLFERHPRFDPEGVAVPNEVFSPHNKDGLLYLFNRYNFTINEAGEEESDVALDPELLGKVFENLLADEKRTATGSFYTPRAVVRSMCRDTLARHLARNTENTAWDETFFMQFFEPEEERRIELKPRDAEKIIEVLRDIKVLDPAVGSGAFPLGMLHTILHVRRILENARGLHVDDHGAAITQWKEEIIRDSLYGVDILPQAVDMCRLRLWLSLVVDQSRESVRPLPNLDYNIMQGDSLRETVAGIEIYHAPKMTKGAHQRSLGAWGGGAADPVDRATLQVERIHALKASYAGEHDAQVKRRLRRDIDDALYQTMVTGIDHQIQQLEQRIEVVSKKDNYRGREREVRHLERQLTQLEQTRIQVQDRLWSTFFIYELSFQDIYSQKGGFDIVIGNPPYLRTEAYKDLMDEFDVGSSNLYGMFWARAIRSLVREGGQCSFITPDTFLTIRTHLRLRAQLAEKTIVHILQLPNWFFTFRNQLSCILTIVAEWPDDGHRVRACDFSTVPQGDYESLEIVPALWRGKQTGSFDVEVGSNEERVPVATYSYAQSLPFKSSRVPFFVADPEIFALMHDAGPAPALPERELGVELPIPTRQVCVDTEIPVVRIGDVADVRQGLATADNAFYLRKRKGARGSLELVDQDLVLRESELAEVVADENLRLKGIPKDRFEGRCYVPYDKGAAVDESMDTFPDFWRVPEYYINWSEDSVRRLYSLTIAERDGIDDPSSKQMARAAVIRNPTYYFRPGLTFSLTATYSPSFRINNGGVFDVKGSNIFFEHFDETAALGLMTSPVFRYVAKNYVQNTVDLQVDSLKEVPIPLQPSPACTSLAEDGIRLAKEGKLTPDFYMKLNDAAMSAYGLAPERAAEIMAWMRRRYGRIGEAIAK